VGYRQPMLTGGNYQGKEREKEKCRHCSIFSDFDLKLRCLFLAHLTCATINCSPLSILEVLPRDSPVRISKNS
jgi:hypothetical protein